MQAWMAWMVMAGVLVVFELFTGTFYVLMIAIGLAAGGLAGMLGWTVPLLFLIAATVGLAAIGVLQRSRFGRALKTDAGRDPNVNMDIGQTVQVDAWADGRARARYRGALWDIDLAPGGQPHAGTFRIVEVQGSRLIVSNQ